MKLEFNSPKVMSIINATPDSFFASSRTLGEEDIARRVLNAISEGADILDVGGYSSRPGADEVAECEEIERVCRAVKIIREIDKYIPISIDTFRSKVAERVLVDFGEVIINDISSSELDSAMLDVVSNAKVPYIAMHMRGTPKNMQTKCEYDDIVSDVCEFFDKKLETFAKKGIFQVILDPGFGFAKTQEQNYQLLSGMQTLKSFGKPVLAGISRKSMIYKLLDVTPEQALTGTIALNWQALSCGADILRVHDTKETAQIIKIFNYYESLNRSK
ncbi:MAG: dihydropteroate synthase [Rikenellaceae bacterium]